MIGVLASIEKNHLHTFDREPKLIAPCELGLRVTVIGLEIQFQADHLLLFSTIGRRSG
jgi:hypothetical protein